MDIARFKRITKDYKKLRIAVLGDFCLDRYLEIDPAKSEISIETGLEVYNVTNVRNQPGGAGTILNNLVALEVGQIFPIGFCGEDGEGWELQTKLRNLPRVEAKYFFSTALRRTFTYTKPLVLSPRKIPRELNRLDFKNWMPTPKQVQQKLIRSIRELAAKVDAVIVLDQSDLADVGVVTNDVLKALHTVAKRYPDLLVIADSRRGLREFPPFAFKMNRMELRAFSGGKKQLDIEQIKNAALSLARKNQQPVFVTLENLGIIGALATGEIEHAPALPLRGEIDVVGAGDSVTANLATALSAGATLRESLQIANAAASVVVHKLGTTGTASFSEMIRLLG